MAQSTSAGLCLTGYNAKAAVITAITLALLSLVVVLVILLSTVSSRASLPSLIVTVILSLTLFLAITKTAFGRARGSNSQMPAACSCIWAACEFSMLATRPLEYRRIHIASREGTVEWVVTSEVSDMPGPACTVETESVKTCPCCLDDFLPDSQVAVLPCRHVFHQRCIARWSMASAKKGALCPTCRTEFSSSSQSLVPAERLGRSSA